ncbi:MAG: hypothetical protein HY897_15345 [Deltaproteobacteria bacterium]|nr:hypothetical protein [Deltaproteobacteria bacterium]
MSFKLLQAFENLFRGTKYKHRDSSLGNFVAAHLYEDLCDGGYSAKFNERVAAPTCVVNAAGSTHGVRARRGDGKFGTLVPQTNPVRNPPFVVWQGMVALTQIGVEVKVLAKSQLKQIDRVMTDLASCSDTIKAKSPQAITVGVTAVNYSHEYTGYEGKRAFPVDRTPDRARAEADEVSRRIEREVKPRFDEFLLLKFNATNRRPFPFAWLDAKSVNTGYGAALVRIAAEYDRRF